MITPQQLRSLKESNEKQEALKKLALHYQKTNRYRFFIPNGKAEEFVTLFGRGERMIYMFLGGNGASKTCTMVNLIANLCWPGKNDWFKGTMFENWPYEKTIRIASDPTTISDKIVPEMKKWFPVGRFNATKDKKNYLSKWTTDTEWNLDLMTFDQDVKEFESVDRGLILFDEIPPEAIFNASISRLRLGGKIGIFMTPLAQAGYLFDRYIENPNEQAEYVFVDVEDNCAEHGTRGFLKHKNIEEIIANYDEDEKEARVHGKFMHLAGTIYKSFDKSKHVLETFEEVSKKWIPNTWKVAWAIDPHPVIQVSVMFMAILRDGRKVIIDEIWEHLEMQDLAGKIIEKLNGFKKQGGQVERLGLIDPSAVVIDKLRGNVSIKNDLHNYLKVGGYSIIEAPRDRDRGEDLVKQELKGTINPNLYVTSNCVQTIWEFGHYSKDPKNPTKRLDKNDHFMENMYRLVLTNMHPMFATTREQKRKNIIGIGQ